MAWKYFILGKGEIYLNSFQTDRTPQIVELHRHQLLREHRQQLGSRLIIIPKRLTRD